jgi:flagellar motor switch protein FliN/FliY
MAEDMDFESFEQLDDLDWSQLEDDVKKEGAEAAPDAGESGDPGEPSMGGDANAAKVARSDKFIDINYLLDVNLQITVEVGRKQAYISQVLGYDHGSIVELDKLVGEPLDLLVNKKRVARGEIVVVNEKFAIKITDILDPNDRLAQIMA